MLPTLVEVVISPLILYVPSLFYCPFALQVIIIIIFSTLTPADRCILLTGETQRLLSIACANPIFCFVDLQLPVAEMLRGILSLPAAENGLYSSFPSRPLLFYVFACRSLNG